MDDISNAPIGVFDSGLGGVSVLKEALRLLPTENYIYFGDNLHAPYGDRSETEIAQLTLASVRTLSQMGCKAILIACNTATANCIGSIRSECNIPVISVEPAIRPACMQPGNGKILMMATAATTKLERYLALQQRMPDPSRVINIPCSGLVERIEAGIWADDAFDDLFDLFLSPYEGLEVDGIVLGCTHYVFIPGAFQRAAARHLRGSCKLFDGNTGTVHQLGRVLWENGIYSTRKEKGQVTFCTSGDHAHYKALFDRLLAQ